MNENDQLQLIDPAIIRHVVGLDADALWQLTLERLDDLKRLEKFQLGALYGLKFGKEHFEKVFWRFCDEDPDAVRWGLINDLGFIGKPLRIDPWAASGYLDHGSSAEVESSRDILPEWDEDSEARHYSRRFDIINATHLDLIAASLDNHHNLGIEDDHAKRLQIRTMAKTLRNDPTLRAAYIYQT